MKAALALCFTGQSWFEYRFRSHRVSSDDLAVLEGLLNRPGYRLRSRSTDEPKASRRRWSCARQWPCARLRATEYPWYNTGENGKETPIVSGRWPAARSPEIDPDPATRRRDSYVMSLSGRAQI